MNYKLKTILKKSKLVCKIYYRYKKKNDINHKIDGQYSFIDRSIKSKDVCIILAGYKEILWDNVFSRINAYAPPEMDICIISSGLYSSKLADIAEKYNWSYISTSDNKITLALNIALNIFSKAENVYKLDEDIFITKEFFDSLKTTYDFVTKEEKYVISFVAPLIPINTYGYVRLLEKYNLVSEWESKFNRVTYTDGLSHHCDILKNPDAAKFLWGNCKKFADIDILSQELNMESFKYSVCSTRFSIGAVYFKRDFWLEMGMFEVIEGNNLGFDEYQMCTFGLDHGKAMIISENCLVGHLAYGPQTAAMLEFYKINSERFKVKNE